MTKRTRWRWRRVVVIVGVVISALGLAVLPWAGEVASIVDGLVDGGARDVAWAHGERERVTIAGGPRAIVADFYAAPGPTQRPLVILLHGSGSRGRRGALPRLLATQLQGRGAPVLAIDLRGFGESEDPDPASAEPFAFVEDVHAAIAYAIEQGRAPGGRVVLVGHSLGASVSLHAASAPDVAGVVALGAPPTRARFERGGKEWRDQGARDLLRRMNVEPLPRLVTAMGAFVVEMDVERRLESPNLAPCLLVYGEHEAAAMRESGELDPAALASTGDGRRVHIVPNAGHHYRTKPPLGAIVFHDSDTLDGLIEAIVAFLDEL